MRKIKREPIWFSFVQGKDFPCLKLEFVFVYQAFYLCVRGLFMSNKMARKACVWVHSNGKSTGKEGQYFEVRLDRLSGTFYDDSI